MCYPSRLATVKRRKRMQEKVVIIAIKRMLVGIK
jgi:hypothetical protein